MKHKFWAQPATPDKKDWNTLTDISKLGKDLAKQVTVSEVLLYLMPCDILQHPPITKAILH